VICDKKAISICLDMMAISGVLLMQWVALITNVGTIVMSARL
jgi:hypothetical protein